MKETAYVIISYGNTGHNAKLTQTEQQLRYNYDEAYSFFSEVCFELNGTHPPLKPDTEQPMRQENRKWIVELWIVNRINNL
jgi:hypothetical protein